MVAVERLPIHQYSADYIFIFSGIIGLIENGVLLMYMLEGVRSVANFITAYEQSIKQRLPFSICNVFFDSKGYLLDFYKHNLVEDQLHKIPI